MKTEIFNYSKYINGKFETKQVLYKIMPENWGKKIKKFAVNMEIGIYALNCTGDKYYWANNMTGGGNWNNGGFYIFPILNNPSDIIIDRQTGIAYKYIKEIN
jgi:hypothetical protein